MNREVTEVVWQMHELCWVQCAINEHHDGELAHRDCDVTQYSVGGMVTGDARRG